MVRFAGREVGIVAQLEPVELLAKEVCKTTALFKVSYLSEVGYVSCLGETHYTKLKLKGGLKLS